MSKKKERQIELVSYIDKDNTHPCKECRKRNSCFLKLKDGKCISFEEGVPWEL